VSLPQDEVDELKAIYGQAAAAAAEETEITYVRLDGLPMPTGSSPTNVDVLICPVARDGYAARLYFSERVSSTVPLNWNGNAFILGRNWVAFSLNVPANLRLAQIVAVYLRALNPL
jgi:hypothetical protein